MAVWAASNAGTTTTFTIKYTDGSSESKTLVSSEYIKVLTDMHEYLQHGYDEEFCKTFGLEFPAPDEILKIFSFTKCIEVGKKHGTICVIIDGQKIEITTYRIESGYSDTRHPDSVSFSSKC